MGSHSEASGWHRFGGTLMQPILKDSYPTIPWSRRSVLNVHGKDWCWRWNSNTLATWCKELTHLKRPWCWERLKVGEEGDDRGWDGWMASLTQWTWVWVNSRSWGWTVRPGVLQSMGSKSQTCLSNWTELTAIYSSDPKQNKLAHRRSRIDLQ